MEKSKKKIKNNFRYAKITNSIILKNITFIYKKYIIQLLAQEHIKMIQDLMLLQ